VYEADDADPCHGSSPATPGPAFIQHPSNMRGRPNAFTAVHA
jgi:hypothetical protein